MVGLGFCMEKLIYPHITSYLLDDTTTFKQDCTFQAGITLIGLKSLGQIPNKYNIIFSLEYSKQLWSMQLLTPASCAYPNISSQTYHFRSVYDPVKHKNANPSSNIVMQALHSHFFGNFFNDEIILQIQH